MSSTFTGNLHLEQPDFNFGPWHDAVNNNMAIIDAAYSFLGVSISGVWTNSHLYTVGTFAIDPVDLVIYRVLIQHTSAAAPTTFAQDRVANPTFWAAMSSTSNITLDGNSGTERSISWRTNTGVLRWKLAKNATAEGGANAGSDLALGAYSDAGALLTTPITITRSTGAIAFATAVAFTVGPTAPTAAPGTNTTQVATTGFVKAAVDVILGGVAAAFDTLSELAAALPSAIMTTRGDIIYRDATTAARLAKGTTGKVLTMNANDPNWEEPDIKFLQTGNLTGATVDIVLTSFIALGYTNFRLTMENAQPATDNTALWLRVSNNAGSSFATVSYKSLMNTTDGVTQATSNSAVSFLLSAIVGNQSGEDAQIEAFIRAGSTVAFVTSNAGRINGTPAALSDGQIGTLVISNVDAIRLMPASGNWNAGSYKLWGIKDS